MYISFNFLYSLSFTLFINYCEHCEQIPINIDRYYVFLCTFFVHILKICSHLECEQKRVECEQINENVHAVIENVNIIIEAYFH